MSGNRKAKDTIGAARKKCKVISLEEKLSIITKHEAGATKAKISRDLGMSESTIRHIVQHAEQYKKQGQSASTSTASQTTRNRSSLMIEMERLLLVWIEDCNQKRIHIACVTKAM